MMCIKITPYAIFFEHWNSILTKSGRLICLVIAQKSNHTSTAHWTLSTHYQFCFCFFDNDMAVGGSFSTSHTRITGLSSWQWRWINLRHYSPSEFQKLTTTPCSFSAVGKTHGAPTRVIPSLRNPRDRQSLVLHTAGSGRTLQASSSLPSTKLHTPNCSRRLLTIEYPHLLILID